jgi:phosphopantetheinyl transferase (holo-ACP synthase)
MALVEALTEQDIIEPELALLDFEPEEKAEQEGSNILGKWLYYALDFDVYNSKDTRLRLLVDRIYDEIKDYGTLCSQPSKKKQALKTVLINLWKANDLGKPVKYSRNKSDYQRGNRYNDLFFKYDTLIPVINALEDYGYINHKNGRSRYQDKTQGLQSRMWATPLLVNLFQKHKLVDSNFYYKPETVDIIRLFKKKKSDKQKNSTKIPVNFKETKTTKQIRKDLKKYNNFVKKHYITLNINRKSIITYNLLLNILLPKIKDNQSKFTIINDNHLYHNFIYNKLSNKLYITYKYNNNINNNYSIPLPYITQRFSCKEANNKALYENLCEKSVEAFSEFLKGCSRTLLKSMSSKEIEKLLNTEFQLKDIGIENVQVRLDNETLYRVFSRGVQSLKYGGRAYGALYQTIPSDLRKTIRINDEPTVERDYSAYHIRMLYHLKGQDYREDPYSACAGEEYRDVFKCASLTLINAKDEATAKGATREELKKRGIPLPYKKEPLNWLLEKFKEAHEPIAEFICADMGVRLQNIDSHIMNAILMRLMDREILGLNVYDSVIVAKQHETELVEAMMEEYKKEMGFEPVI